MTFDTSGAVQTAIVSPHGPVPASALEADGRTSAGERAVRTWNDLVPGPEIMELPTGRVVSARFIVAAVRRWRRVWMLLAALGLVLAAGYHVLSPAQYTATTTLYLAHVPNTDITVAAQTDLAMLDTVTVGKRALASLGDHQLAPLQLLGATPGRLASDDVLVIGISGPSPHQAVVRTDAVARAYLSFRAQQYDAQEHAFVLAAQRQIARLDAKLKSLTAQIGAVRGTGGGQKLAALVAQRGATTAQIVTLQQTVHQDLLASKAVAGGSRVITPATVVTRSSFKRLALDSLIGLGGGLAVGIGAVIAYAVLSDRLRRREDVAAVLGAPVVLSVPRFRGSLLQPVSRSRSPRAGTAADPVAILYRHLLDAVPATGGPPPAKLVVAVDDARVPAAAMAHACRTLSANGGRVGAVDATRREWLADALGSHGPGTREVDVGGTFPVTLHVPAAPWYEDGAGGERPAELSEADVVFVVADVDLGAGAAHLHRWSPDAVVTLRAGGATAQRVNAVARVLRAAGVAVSSAVLLDSDEDDESTGYPDEAFSPPPHPRASLTGTTAPR